MKRKNYWFLLLCLLFLPLFINCQKKKDEKGESGPKSARYWTSPIIRPEQVPKLAKTDLLIVDLENMFNNYQALVEIKKLNPELKLLAYSNPMEIWLTKFNSRPWQNKVIDEITKERPQWLLKTIDNQGQRDYAKFWPGMIMLNMSQACPRVNRQRYSPWMAKKLSKEILSDTIWDGYFMDNGTPNISWTNPGRIDINDDGRTNSNQSVDNRWERGVRGFLRIIRRQQGRDFLIITNKGDLSFLDIANGKMFENFPNNWLGDKRADGWYQSMANAQRTGYPTIFSINRGEAEFGLASALLLDNVYLAIGQDDDGHFEKFDINLGKPLGPYYQVKKGLFRRYYQKGRVDVEPHKRKGRIVLK